MKKLLIAILIALSVGTSAFAWETFAEYEMFCFVNGIEPSYEEFEYYSRLEGQGYPVPNELEIIDDLMNK